jgi:dihydroflavonol-4-reductase
MRGGMHFTDVRDVARALLTLVAHPSPRPVYHLTGLEEPLPEFFRRIARVGGVALRAPVVPTGPVWALSWLNQRLGRRALGLFPDPVLVEMSSRHWGLRSRYAERDLGYAPRPPDETLRDTIAWLRGSDSP